MKERISVFKKFVCFYISLPLFVLMLFGTGVMAARDSDDKLPKNLDMEYDFEEYEIIPSESIRDESSNPLGTSPIVARNLSKDYDILNATDEQLDESALLSMPLPHQYGEEPTVLVVHTHGTECYADESESFPSADRDGNWGYYTSKSKTRSTDTSKNVIAIGQAFCSVLAENSISSIQCRIMHDKDDYNSAYSNSRESIKYYLEKYPSIKYVIDIHRDSLGGDGGEKIKTLANCADNCAQVMLVAGCNGNGVVYPKWEENLSLALKFKKAMDNEYPSLSRPIYLRYSRYNLDLTEGSLLLEVGSCANTFDEALTAVKLAAECFAKMLQ